MNTMVINIFGGLGVNALEGLSRFNPDGNEGYDTGGLKIDNANYLLVVESNALENSSKSLYFDFKNNSDFKKSITKKVSKLEDRGFQSVMVALVEKELPVEKDYKFNTLLFLSDYNRDTLKKRKMIKEVNKFTLSEQKSLAFDKMANKILDNNLLEDNALAFILEKDAAISGILSDIYFTNKDNKWLQS